ncbi:Poly-beta-1,6-N-acetyl-D-glucosamine synthase [Fundidesulfovibrio magnetotacticus]|uniref:Poly-beta-1,6-N-acetyl-D-glucosamine synthase n=1 Tax=Fundidesulfovibrio magnetotacticus TaxID=2730080 RepID=A0A6V8LSQ8_9BACT|nr:glycosyltransferase family 2 protein [Fundidesulfovibrio magnetotacticus]GFK95512.1 Poly-beta-1,6-N-acetyl-D-glucosamine synthase [Fundidesulfovibrio magnetotacticus]
MSFGAFNRINLSVVTYCFNDHALADGLVDSVAGWSVVPREVIVVDDGSAEPYKPAHPADNLRVLRLAPNRGAALAHTAGMGAASGRYLLSIDCDIRLPRDWVRLCLPLAERTGVGMVSSRLRCTGSSSLTNRYVDLLYGVGPQGGETGFVQGGVFLMRRDVFESVGGYSGYEERTGEDSFLCARLAERGFRMLLNPEVEAHEVRRLSRVAAVRRKFFWQSSQYFQAIARGEPVDKVLYVFHAPCFARLGELLRQEVCLGYYELLLMVFGACALARSFDAGFAARLRWELTRRVRGLERLGPLLLSDLRELGAPEPQDHPEPLGLATVNAWDAQVDDALLHALDRDCAQALAAEDAGGADFSVYERLV